MDGMDKIIKLMLAVREWRPVFYHKDTNKFDRCPISEIEGRELDFDAKIPIKDLNNFMLPSYEDINHEDIMRFFVKEAVNDKEIRKQLFNILRRHDYIDPFIDKLHEFNLYDDFVISCRSIYFQIFKEWADENELDFKKK